MAQPSLSAVCPGCGETLIPKCGEIKVWHWSHIGGSDCDPWHEPMTQWHLDWQNRFPFDCREETIRRGDEIHRADIRLPCGVVLEFQHSPISTGSIQAREYFYQRMMWIFDLSDAYRAGRMEIRPRDGFHSFIWRHCKQSISHCERPIVFDLGNGEIFRVSKLYPSQSEGFCFNRDHPERSYSIDARPAGGWGHVMRVSDFVDMLKKGKKL